MTTGDNNRADFLIVGVGASAGGLDTFQRFLKALPVDFGFALVFIQHLSSKHKSLLAELLSAGRPSLVIQQISDGLKIQPGRLYLAPPGREIRLRNGFFQTAVHPEGLIHLPIDEFLTSLAEDAAERSIAVIFSGAGTDGSRGCQAVRSVGGAVFVQDPQTAEFSSMPLAAIATGQADAVLQPEGIAAELLKLQGIGPTAVHPEFPITPEEYDDFFRLLREKTGGRFNHYKKSVVGRRIRRRMDLHRFPMVKDYLDLVSTSDTEAALLTSDLMIGVTSFFRDRVAWKALNLEAVRRIAAEDTGLPVRVWTPASSTGEEAYSIAMMLLRELDLAGRKRDVHVFATDVNNRALERAREGRYPAGITADVPQEYIQKYFTSTDDGNVLVINKDVRDCVVFARQDLLTDPPFSKLDLIICRNFLIYLEPEAQEKSITLFHYALKDGGFLFLGNAETVGRKSRLFQSIGHKPCRVYRKLESKPASRLPISVPYASERAAQAPKPAQLPEQKKSVTEIIQEKLLEEYGPASVAIDQNYEIIYHNGPTNRYLRQPRGVPTQNLMELVPENLRSRIRGALYRSGQEGKTVSIRASLALNGESSPSPQSSPRGERKVKAPSPRRGEGGGEGSRHATRPVTLRITKVSEILTIIVFQEKGAPSKKEAAEAVDAAVIEENAIHQLESELSATKADLQSHIEQLKSLNEELQSSNEELQAANEELETSREELQSLNEELITVNAQLQGKIEEQDATNDDLNNFQASTNIPAIFLDHRFRVKRFTPAISRLLELIPSDVGRPLIDMSQEKLGPDLIADARAVLDSLAPVKREMKIDDTWYLRATLPYRTADSKIEGVVVTYSDVTGLKEAEERTRHLASFPQLNPNPVCEVHSSGKVTFCNPATEKILVNLGMGREDVAVFLPADIDDILRDLEKNEETTLYREIEIKDRVFGMTVHLAPQFNVARIYAYDISERKRAEAAVRESEQRLRLAHQAANIGAFDWNVQTGVNIWTPQLEAMYGLVRGEFGKTQPAWEQMVHPEDRAAALGIVNHTLETGEPVEGEWRVVWRDGSVHWIAGRFQAFKDATGKPLRLSGVNMDITERKRTEEALRESEERLKRSQEISHLGSWELDLVNNRLFWSDEVYRIFGLKPQEFGATYEAFLEAVHPDDRAAVDAAYSGSLREGRDNYEIEHRIMRKATGEVRIVHEKCEHLRDNSGRVIKSVGMVHDITERKRAEEALAASEAKYRSLFENMINGFAYHKIVIDELGKPVDYVFLEVNEAFEKLTGLKRTDIIGKTVREVLPGIETDSADWIGTYGRIALTGGEARFEQYAEPLDQWYSVSVYSPLKGYFVTIFENITDRKRAEEALRKSEEQFRTLADSIPNLAWWANGDGYITWYNRRWYEYTGMTPEQMEGWGWQSVHDPKALPAVMEQWKKSLSTGEPFDMEFPLRGADGVFRPFLTRVMPLKDPSGLVIRWFGTNTDISAIKQAEEALRKSEEQFRSMFERHRAVMLLIEPETGTIVDANASAAEFYGWPIEALRSLMIQDINQMSPDDVAAERKRALEEDRNYFVFPHKLADGHIRWVEVYSSPITVQGRSLLFSIIHDITERRQAEEALHQAAETFERVFKGNAAALALSRIEDGTFLEVNDRFLEMTGYSREEVIGKKPPVAWKNPEDRAAMIREVQERGAITGREYRILRKSGEEFIALFFAQSINLRGQELMISSAVDITARKKAMEDAVAARRQAEEANIELRQEIAERMKAEEALRRSEEQYRNLIETASEGIWIGDFEGRTTFVNESVTTMIGYRPEELIGKTAYDFMDEEARAIARFNLEQRRQGHKNSYEIKFIRKDGSPLWVIVGAAPLRDKNGNAIASMAMLTDITARKLAEEKSRHQQAVLTSINRIFREALITDSEEELGRVCLSIAEELTNSKFGFIGEIGPDGMLHDTAISDPGWELCTMKDKTDRHKQLGAFKMHGLVGRVIIDERPFFTNDPYAHPDSVGTPEGHPRLTAFLGVPLVHRGKTIGLIALGNREEGYRTGDVETMEPIATVIVQALMRKRTESSLQAAHAELKQRAYELEAVNRDLEVYSYTVSHDLKAPLRSIDGFARALLEDYGDKLDSTASDYLVRINTAAQRMDQLIKAMLDMARLTRRDLNEQSVDLSALAQVIADDLRKQDPARMVEFIIADQIRVRGDNALLHAVLENLMDNAWKFTRNQKAARIEFGVTTMHGHSVYFVKDNGAGFDMQFADKLFLPFKRLHLDSEFAGLGIGLATAYRIILRHNGRLWAESAPEKGATFYFTLP
jgi:two-component system CheB/CheR fusion protein